MIDFYRSGAQRVVADRSACARVKRLLQVVAYPPSPAARRCLLTDAWRALRRDGTARPACGSVAQLMALLVATSMISSRKRGVLTNTPRTPGSAYAWL